MVLQEFINEWQNSSDKLLVHTSGSTGKPKPLWVEKERMAASARMTCRFLGLKQGDTALLCLPLDYIAGKMVVVRTLVWGLKLIEVKPSGHPLHTLEEAPTFAAMVPMQVYNSLDNTHDRRLLMNIKQLIIGGGAIDPALEKALKEFPNAVWSTYGMTETLSHIALRRLNGREASPWYTPFDTVEVGLTADHCLWIKAPEVCEKTLETNDIAEMASDGRRFRIIGRKDNVICSGGIKIHIEEVESLLKPVVKEPFMVTKRKDEKLGETVVLLLQGNLSAKQLQHIKAVVTTALPPYWQPHHYILVPALPYTETGKPARKEAERMAMQDDKGSGV